MRTARSDSEHHHASEHNQLLGVDTLVSGDASGGDDCGKPRRGRAPIPDTASPLDALPEAVRLVADKPFTEDFDEIASSMHRSWLASMRKINKDEFWRGSLFVAGGLFVLARWWTSFIR